MEPDGALAFMGHSVRQKKVTRSLVENIELGNSRSWETCRLLTGKCRPIVKTGD
jgi:hypothetical protein